MGLRGRYCVWEQRKTTFFKASDFCSYLCSLSDGRSSEWNSSYESLRGPSKEAVLSCQIEQQEQHKLVAPQAAQEWLQLSKNLGIFTPGCPPPHTLLQTLSDTVNFQVKALWLACCCPSLLITAIFAYNKVLLHHSTWYSRNKWSWSAVADLLPPISYLTYDDGFG